MSIENRRKQIVDILNAAKAPVPAKDLADRFGVSRQVIVQDIAVIRAAATNVMSTSRGYIIQHVDSLSREFCVRHNEEDTQKELNLIVDSGGRVRNISIDHCVYGRISANLDLSSRQDVEDFMESLRTGRSSMLGKAANGYHRHLVEAASEVRLDRIEEKLREAGFLVEEEEASQ